MTIHLTTGIGGHIEILPQMLEHYKNLGVSSFIANVHVSEHDAPDMLDRAKRITDRFGIRLSSVNRGPWYTAEEKVYTASRAERPNDWFILADQDEFHEYPMELQHLVELCESNGYDYVSGCFVDRLASDGGLPDIDCARPISRQFPLGAFLSHPLTGAYPLKIVLAKGNVKISIGQHYALSGKGCPIEEAFVKVHHYKWVSGLISRMVERKSLLIADGLNTWKYSERTIKYYREHDFKVDIKEPLFLISDCFPHYKYWEKIKEIAVTARNQGIFPPTVFGREDYGY